MQLSNMVGDRILYVTDGISPWVIGGMQAVARRHVGWLHAAGYKVTVIASRSEMPEAVDFADRLVTLPWPKKGKIRRLSPWNYRAQLIEFSRMVSQQIDHFRPDLIWAEGPLVADYFRRPRKLRRVPVVFHPHGLEMFQKTGSNLIDSRLIPLRSLTRLHTDQAEVTISQGGKIDAILRDRLRVPLDRIYELPNCLPAQFRVADRPRQTSRRRFIFVGRNEARKGLSLLLQSLEHVPEASLDVVGDVPADISAPSNVNFHGMVRDRDALRGFFDRADFLVVPSYAEGMPTVILEGLAAGLPVIATDVGASGALVADRQTGFLIPRGDGDALTKALRAAAALNDREYRELSANALARIMGDFSEENVRLRLLTIVDRLLALTNAASAPGSLTFTEKLDAIKRARNS